MAIADRIKLAREKKRWSRSELARRIGLNPSSAVQWESPRGTAPTVENLAKLAVALGVHFEWLATGRGPMVYVDPQQDRRDIHQIRRDNLEAIISKMEDSAARGLLAGTSLGGHNRPLGDDDIDDIVARHVESLAGKPYGWMDHQNVDVVTEERLEYANALQDKDLTALAMKFAEMLLSVPEDRLREAARLLDRLHHTTPDDDCQGDAKPQNPDNGPNKSSKTSYDKAS